MVIFLADNAFLMVSTSDIKSVKISMTQYLIATLNDCQYCLEMSLV